MEPVRKRRGRPPSRHVKVHTAVGLDPLLLEKIKQEAKKSGLGVSGEIRDRLWSTFTVIPEMWARIKELEDHVAPKLFLED